MGASGRLLTPQRILSWFAIAALTVLLVVPSVSASNVPGGRAPVVAAPFAGSVSSEAVAWDGVNASQAASAGSAFVVSTGASARVVFSFFGPPGGANLTAELQVYYFGTVISTESVATLTSPLGVGSGVMNWSFGAYSDLLEGLYRFTASLVNSSSGATIWSENFYVDEQAPYRIVSGFPLFLIALAGSEAYTLALTRRRVRRRRGRSPPAAWTAAPPPDSGTSPPGSDAGAAGPPPLPDPASGARRP